MQELEPQNRIPTQRLSELSTLHETLSSILPHIVPSIIIFNLVAPLMLSGGVNIVPCMPVVFEAILEDLG